MRTVLATLITAFFAVIIGVGIYSDIEELLEQETHGAINDGFQGIHKQAQVR